MIFCQKRENTDENSEEKSHAARLDVGFVNSPVVEIRPEGRIGDRVELLVELLI